MIESREGAGFADAHLHLLAFARTCVERDLGPATCPTVEHVLEALVSVISDGPRASGWVVARGFDDALVAERRLPTRRELDRVCPDVPLRIRHRTGHASLLNSAACRRIDLNLHRIEPDANGDPVLVLEAERAVDAFSGRPPRAELVAGLALAEAHLRRAGIDRVWDATPRTLAARAEFEGLLAEARFSILARTMAAPEERRAEPLDEREVVKILPHDPAAVEPSVALARRRGASVAIHATTAIEVDAATAALQRHAGEAFRDRVEHCTLLSAEQARRIAALGATIVFNPGWLDSRRTKYAEQLRPAEQRALIPMRTALDAGCRIAFGSDAPVDIPNPRRWLTNATTRPDGEAISVEEAWAAATGGGLWDDPSVRTAA